MNEYLLSVIGAVLLSALLTAILPEGKTAPVIKAVSRMVCVLAIIAPVLTFFQKQAKQQSVENLPTFFKQSVIDGQETFIKYYSEMRVRDAEISLEEEIRAKYGIPVEITLLWENDGKYNDFDEIKIIRICVELMKKAEEEVVSEMMEYLRKNYCSEVQIE